MWDGALYTVDKQLRELRHYDLGLCIRGANVTCTHIVVCGDIAYPTINGVSRISAKGVLQVRLNMERGEGGGALAPQIFALQVLKFLKSL